MGYDYKKVYERHTAWIDKRPKYRAGVLFACRFLSLPFAAAYLGLWIFLLYRGETRDFWRVGLPPACAFLLVTALRALIYRPRPYEKSGAGITPLRPKDSVCNSFPSRHLACASVIAFVLLPYAPIVGGGLLALSILLGYARFAVGWHYPSDLFVGFALGVFIGATVFFL